MKLHYQTIMYEAGYYPDFCMDVYWNDDTKKFDDADIKVGPKRIICYSLDDVLRMVRPELKPFFEWVRLNQKQFICEP